ncbi:hypothetical protein A2647_01555 [Candidatus Nomurabacteria bacterium RIFCSPHIGHO2_01_FULL_40_24b]|uniref:Uncharacterized protein n=1 Tax=Candidatus Nomurabacteria bacterium RIFCSPHIGHO2_01_FULL_40_24b TaxID=1801739 RepID=A0A1F6V8Q1_9BACT|nr:MAG: hypothetical protein A2647_01555 [Candidatus Nomurabacteria bacterium RIFCSPHIGHO2_01_FULL_40_24b]
MFNAEEIQKIIQDLKRIKTKVPEQDLEKTAQNLYDLALFLVRLQIKQHLKPPKPQNAEDLPTPTDKSP